MYYVCVENNQAISVLNYKPSVPNSVKIVEISDLDYKKLEDQIGRFDVAASKVIDLSADILASKEVEIKNGQEREFLNSTDWKVLRHIREKALNIPTTLSDYEYLELEKSRNSAAARII
jgi:hypothetical protein